MAIEITIYDTWTRRYDLKEFERLTDAALNAADDGYRVTYDEYQGQCMAWASVADEGEAAIFKLKYL